MRRRLTIVAFVVLFLMINAFVLCFRVFRVPEANIKGESRREMQRPVIVSAHQERVNKRVETIRSSDLDEVAKNLDDDWVMLYSGVHGGGSVTSDSGYDFALVLGCRLRRRLIQEWESLPVKTRQDKARELHQDWIKKQQDRYEERLTWFVDDSKPLNRFRVEGTKLAVCTGLFCCARWNSARETYDLLKQSREFSRSIATRLPSVTKDDMVLEMMPKSILPDSSFQISVLAYAAKNDESISRDEIAKIESLLQQSIGEGLMERVDIPWQAWDCGVVSSM